VVHVIAHAQAYFKTFARNFVVGIALDGMYSVVAYAGYNACMGPVVRMFDDQENITGLKISGI